MYNVILSDILHISAKSGRRIIWVKILSLVIIAGHHSAAQHGAGDHSAPVPGRQQPRRHHGPCPAQWPQQLDPGDLLWPHSDLLWPPAQLVTSPQPASSSRASSLGITSSVFWSWDHFLSLFDFYYINVDVVSFSLSKNQPIFQACPKQNILGAGSMEIMQYF